MFERRESAAVEEVLYQVPEGTFDFALRLRVARAAGDRPEPIIGGESQKAGVVNRLHTVMGTDHDLEVVVETIGGDAFQIREGLNMLANRGGEVLTFDKIHILPAAVSQNVAEGMDTTFAFRREIDIVGRIIHLCLDTGTGFKAANQLAWVAA